MATVNYKCPNCAGPLKFNPDKQMFSCEYCMSDFEEKVIQDMYAKKEQKESSEEKAENKARKTSEESKENSGSAQEEEAVVYTCPSCGAQVVTTASTAATICFYCQNPVVLGGRLSGEFKPDRVVPFALTKEKAIEKFISMCKKKWFLPKDFVSQKQFDKLTGVYFPYWYIDTQKQANMTALGNKIRTWRSGNKRYTETSTYRLVRSGDIIINNLFERALKSQDRNMLQCVHPFDLTKACPFAMSYLSGFQAEKRDIEQNEIKQQVDAQMHNYCQTLLKDTMAEYTGIKTENYNDTTELEAWSYTLLPVWVVTYKYKGKILPFAINGQTGKTYGELPTSNGKLAILFAVVAVVLMALGLLGGLLL